MEKIGYFSGKGRIVEFINYPLMNSILKFTLNSY